MIWVCEWSPVQRAFHVDTLERVLEVNCRNVKQGLDPGFVVIYVGLTREDAHAFADRWRCEHGG